MLWQIVLWKGAKNIRDQRYFILRETTQGNITESFLPRYLQASDLVSTQTTLGKRLVFHCFEECRLQRIRQVDILTCLFIRNHFGITILCDREKWVV